MLHGNLLLKGWWIADVSFYTTELPEYMIVTALRGLRPDVVHICGALTYTLMVLLAAMLARGQAKGREGLVRALVAGAIMLAPSVLGGTEVFLENPDHAGTAVPILALFLLLDRASPEDTGARGMGAGAPHARRPICAVVGAARGLRGARRGPDRGPARARRGHRADRRRRRGPACHAGAAAPAAAGVLVRRGAARRGRGLLRAGQRLAASDPQVRRLLPGAAPEAADRADVTGPRQPARDAPVDPAAVRRQLPGQAPAAEPLGRAALGGARPGRGGAGCRRRDVFPERTSPAGRTGCRRSSPRRRSARWSRASSAP